MLLNEVIARLGSGICSRHVNDNPTIVRTDESHVGYVESSHLVKFVGYHFKQSVYAVELRLSPQTRVGCLRSIALQKIPFFHRIRNFAFFVQYSVSIDTCDKAPVGIFIILTVVEIQFRLYSFVGTDSVFRSRFLRQKN